MHNIRKFVFLVTMIILIFSIPISCISETNVSPTPEPKYTGKCHRWSEAMYYANQETCVWGFATSAVAGSWVWLHFSEVSYPFPNFAADIAGTFDNGQVTVNSIDAKYVGHCVEVYGFMDIVPNTYNDKTVDQPVIHIYLADQLKYCDNLITK